MEHRFDQWLLLSSFSRGDNAEARKRAAFCTYIGSETFTLLCYLCTPGKPLPIYVSHRGVNIIGRGGQKQLNIVIDPQQFGLVPTVSLMESKLHDLLSMQADLLKPGLDCCTIARATLVLRETAQPKYCKPRKLLFAIKPLVGAELDYLEKDGVIERVSHSDWATPIVVICKPTGKVRICGDFKVTLKPMLKLDVHPFPLPEELFHKLNQGCKFSKINLPDAYLQIELDDKSKDLAVINTHQGLHCYKRLPFGLSSAPAVFPGAAPPVRLVRFSPDHFLLRFIIHS